MAKKWEAEIRQRAAKSNILRIMMLQIFSVHTKLNERQVALVAQFDWIATIDCRRVFFSVTAISFIWVSSVGFFLDAHTKISYDTYSTCMYVCVLLVHCYAMKCLKQYIPVRLMLGERYGTKKKER